MDGRLGALPVTLLDATAVTPVWLLTPLMDVALAVALSAVTPAAPVATDTPTSMPLIVNPEPSNALEVTAELVAWKEPSWSVVAPATEIAMV